MKTIVLLLLLFAAPVMADDGVKGPYSIDGSFCYLLPQTIPPYRERGVLVIKAKAGMFQYQYEFYRNYLAVYDHNRRIIGRYVLRDNSFLRTY